MRIERDGGVMTIVNEDPPINRMTLEYLDGVEAAVEEAADDRTVRALVFTADGDENFSVGMDLKQLISGVDDRGGIDAVLDQRRRVLRRIELLGKPSVATLFGYCLGGGLELPLACHFRLAAAEGTRIGLPELELGTVPAWGGTARLTRTVGRANALDMILRVRRISGPEAHTIGLVHEVHPLDVLKERAHELAVDLARRPPVAVEEVLRCVVSDEDMTLDEALDAERAAVHRCARTSDQVEGMRAFVEKRPPQFTGE